MLQTNRILSVLVAALAVVVLAEGSAAQVVQAGSTTVESRKLKRETFLRNAKLVRGPELRTGFIEVTPDLKLGEEEEPVSRIQDTPPVVIDGWTARVADSDGGSPDTFENEHYLFVSPLVGVNTISFLVAIKVPRAGLPQNLVGDLVVVPASPRNGGIGGEDMPPRPAVNVFADDIFFGNPGPGNAAREVIAFVDFPNLEQLTGPGAFDWFMVLDLAGNFQTDDDGDTFADVALEAAGGNVILKLSNSMDQIGADVVDFFTGNFPVVNVFEARGVIPAARPAFAGMLNGEDSTTRPWSFIIQ